MKLRRFWIKFEPFPDPTALNLGCGVTALSRDDALAVLRQRVFPHCPVPSINAWDDDVDVSTLGGKVIPNIGDVTARGVWFPLGYG